MTPPGADDLRPGSRTNHEARTGKCSAICTVERLAHRTSPSLSVIPQLRPALGLSGPSSVIATSQAATFQCLEV